MRSRILVCLATSSLFTACGNDSVEGGGTDGGTDTDTDGTDGTDATTATTATSTTDPTTGATTDASGSGSATSGAGDCTPRETAGCTCDMGVPGQQTCDANGSWGACECGAGTGTDGGSTTDPTTGGSTGATTGATTDPTTGGGAACTETHALTLDAGDATLSGGWELSMSMVGEGNIATIPQGNQTDGSVLWTPDVPCDDTWYVHVRFWEEGQADSYYVTVDGDPTPAAVFEGACDAGGQGYDWKVLNWRDENDGPCQYVEDPWTFDWAAGPHDVEFTYRESWVIARIVVTNDANWQAP